jgi:hypothetical protein
MIQGAVTYSSPLKVKSCKGEHEKRIEQAEKANIFQKLMNILPDLLKSANLSMNLAVLFMFLERRLRYFRLINHIYY